MTSSPWLAWITPPPADGDELNLMGEMVNSIIDTLKPLIVADTPIGEVKRSLKKIQKHLESIEEEFGRLPTSICPRYQGWADQVTFIKTEIVTEHPLMSATRPGRRPEENKSLCLALCFILLCLSNKNCARHRTGSVVRLAKWMWSAAGGDDTTTLDAWGALADGVFKEVGHISQEEMLVLMILFIENHAIKLPRLISKKIRC